MIDIVINMQEINIRNNHINEGRVQVNHQVTKDGKKFYYLIMYFKEREKSIY